MNSVSTYNARSAKSIALSADPNTFYIEDKRSNPGFLMNVHYDEPTQIHSGKAASNNKIGGSLE